MSTLTAKGDDVPWDTWLRRLASRVGHLDDYELIQADPGTDLAAVLSDYCRRWRALAG